MRIKAFTLPIILALALTLTTSIIALAEDYQSANYTLYGAKIVIAGGASYSTNYSLGFVEIGNLTGNTAESQTYSLDTALGDKKALYKPPYIIITNPLDGGLTYESSVILEGTIDGVPFTERKDVTQGPNILTIKDTSGPYTSSRSVEIYKLRTPPALPE